MDIKTIVQNIHFNFSTNTFDLFKMIALNITIDFCLQNSFDGKTIQKEMYITDETDKLYSGYLLTIIEKSSEQPNLGDWLNVRFSKTQTHMNIPNGCEYGICELMNLFDPKHLYDITKIKINYQPIPNMSETDNMYDYIKQIHKHNKEYSINEIQRIKKAHILNRLEENISHFFHETKKDPYKLLICGKITNEPSEKNLNEIIILSRTVNDLIVNIERKYGYNNSIRMYTIDKKNHQYLLNVENILDTMISDIMTLLKM